MKKFYTLAATALVALSASADNMVFSINSKFQDGEFVQGTVVNNGDKVNLSEFMEYDDWEEKYVLDPQLFMTVNVDGTATSKLSLTQNSTPAIDEKTGLGGNFSAQFCALDMQCQSIMAGGNMTKTGAVTAGKNVPMVLEMFLKLGANQKLEDLDYSAEMTLETTLGDETCTLTFYVDKAESGIGGIVSDNNSAPVYFDLQGNRVSEPANGLYIVRQGGKARKVLVK